MESLSQKGLILVVEELREQRCLLTQIHSLLEKYGKDIAQLKINAIVNSHAIASVEKDVEKLQALHS